ncbi:MAG: ABC transporter substrate-binding protein, partial [Acetobacteraceae bacterium]|nr:ABC transporter substrate-binding protein [Acetobacteraceae bacterium]
RGIVDSGDSIKAGIGAMTDARWENFFRSMQQQGLYKPDLDWKKAYTLRFVNKGVGVSTRPN